MMLSVWLSSTTAKKFDLQVRLLHQHSISHFTTATHMAQNPYSCPENLKLGSLGSLNKKSICISVTRHNVLYLQCSYMVASI